jgi:hypothetical protein
MGYPNLRAFLCTSAGHDLLRGRCRGKWANPFTLKRYNGDIKEVLRLYEEHVRGKPHLMASLHELQGKVLACWCKPEPCHGDVLMRLVAEATGQA